MLVAIAAAPARAGADEEDDHQDVQAWTGSIGLGAVWLAGNSRVVVITGNAIIGYVNDDWAVDLEADGAYGRSRPIGRDDWATDAAMAEGQLRAERALAPPWAVFGYVGARTDQPSSLALRVQGELGVLYTAIDVRADPSEAEADDDDERLIVRIGLGAHYEYDVRNQFEPIEVDVPNRSMLAPGFGTLIRARFAHRARLLHHTEAFPKVWGDARVRVDSKTKLYTYLTGRLTFATAFDLEVDTDPAPDRQRFNSAVTLTLELEL